MTHFFTGLRYTYYDELLPGLKTKRLQGHRDYAAELYGNMLRRLSYIQGRRNQSGGGGRGPNFSRSVNPISIEGAAYAHHITTPSPTLNL